MRRVRDVRRGASTLHSDGAEGGRQRLSNGHSSPLAPGVLTGVPVTVLLSPTSEGVMAAQLDLRHEGAMWQWLGLLEAGDLRASLYTLETSALDGLPPREVLR